MASVDGKRPLGADGVDEAETALLKDSASRFGICGNSRTGPGGMILLFVRRAAEFKHGLAHGGAAYGKNE